MNIVCGTDFTEDASLGTTVAAILAGELQDGLPLVHALPGGGQGAVSPEVMNSLFATLHGMLAEEVARVDSTPDEQARLGFPGPAPFSGNEPEVQRILERDLKEKVEATLGEAGARIRVKGNWGRPDCDLIEMANQEQADLIVTGAHQRHGLERLFHMSVSRALLRYAPMNVLVVPATRERMRPLAAGLHRVLVATDLSEAGNQAAREAYSVLGAGGIVLLVHVTHPQALRNGEYEQGLGDRHSQGQPAEHLRTCTDQLRSLVPADAAARGVVTEVEVLEHEKAALAIAQAAERFGASVICMATHGCPRFSAALSGSVTPAVMSRSVRPLLVVHAPPE